MNQEQKTAINNIKSLAKLNAKRHPTEIATMLPYLLQLSDFELNLFKDMLDDKNLIETSSLVKSILTNAQSIDDDVDAVHVSIQQALNMMDISGWSEQIFYYKYLSEDSDSAIRLRDVTNIEMLNILGW